MYVECPECRTIFQMNALQLATAAGLVRCGQCQCVFNANDHEVNKDFFEHRTEDPEILTDDVPAEDSQEIGIETVASLTRELLGKTTHNPWVTATWSGGIILLLITLTLGNIYIQRNNLLENAKISPHIEKLCGKIPYCKLSPRRDLSQLELVSRNVYSHPNADNALMINAVMTNSANYTQPYPLLLVTMSNVRGQIIAQRYFKPTEYLADRQISNNDKMPIGTPVSINLEVIDPGNSALAFELDFL